MNIYDIVPELYLDSRKHKERYLILVTANNKTYSVYKNYAFKCVEAESVVVALRKSGQVVFYHYDIDNIVK
jgi:hypothetical protein